MNTYVESVHSGLKEDTGEADPSDGSGSGPMETIDASEMFASLPGQTGKHKHREETSSEEEHVLKGADMPEPKRTRTGLREYHECRRPGYLDDYVANLTLNDSRVLDKNGRPIRASQVKIPWN
ncbi:hypothetical protein PF003_g27634 [Phytophthora fragariae]|nr:hypothetical protein PF003_g27634 [Phytophthora fragariae]